MSNKTINYILLTGLFVPVILLFWPFAEWNDTASLILRIIPAISVQQLVCRTTKKEFIRAVPIAFSAAAALWGTYLYFTSEHWINATAGGLIADYVSMFICCAAVYAVYKIKEKI